MAAGRDRRRRRGGQSLVEFAVVLPVFLLILAGILDFGLGLYSQMTVINAAREGARLGVVDPERGGHHGPGRRDGGGPRQVAADDQRHLQARGWFRVLGPVATSGDAVIVKVDYGYRMLWPLAFGNTLDLSSTVQMRIE